MIENRDKYLGFTFNGISLSMKSESDFKGFIVNSDADLRFSSGPQYTDEFVVPQYGERTHYTGTTKSNRSFTLNIAINKCTMRAYRQILKWLNPNTTGIFTFDYEDEYGLEVKVASISEGTYYVLKEKSNNEDLYYVDFSVTFTTVYDWAAKWIKSNPFWANTGSLNLINNHYDENFIDDQGRTADESHTTINFSFNNPHRTENYFNIEFDTELEIFDGDTKIVDLNAGTGKLAIYYSEYGISLSVLDKNFISGDPMKSIRLEPSSRKNYKIKVLTSKIDNLKITPISREIL